jgi:hypothetical protein
MISKNMKLTAVVMATMIVGAAMAVPTGAFIRKPVKSVNALVAHMNTDPVVADRFERHFRKSSGELTAYFRTLHLAKLARGGSYTVFNVHDGIIRSRVLNLKKGTLVFADSKGRPILQQVCGNPMVWEVPRIGSSVAVTTAAMEREFVGETTPTDMIAMSEPGVMPVPEDVAPPTGPIVQAPATGMVGGSRSSLLPLLLLGAGAAFIRTGGGGDEPPPVPEPATMAVLAIGFGAVAARRRKKS